MSGGSMDYLYLRVEDAEFDLNTPERSAFKKHLEKIAAAMKAIEWVDSGDSRPGDENEAIAACLAREDVLNQCIEYANIAAKNLRDELERCNSGRTIYQYPVIGK